MTQLAVKLLLAPAFVVAATLATRRWGAVAGGIIGGLPVVAGPILLSFSLQHGARFGAGAARATLLGLLSLAAFVVVYAFAVARRRWPASLLLGWAAFFAATALLSGVRVPAVAGLAAAWATFALVLAVLPDPADAVVAERPSPPWDLPVRAASALALVLVLTAASGSLGPHVSGLLAPFPVIVSILGAFTHAQAGAAQTQRLLRGFVLGFFAFALFCFIVAVTIVPIGIAAGFALAGVAAVLLQTAMFAARGRPRSAAS